MIIKIDLHNCDYQQLINTENLSDILKPDAPLRKYLEQFKQTKDKTIYYHKF